MSDLVLQMVSHDYEGKYTLNGISFELEDGKIGCLMGPSGSGKTTALLCVAGLEKISSGKIMLGGKIISDRNKHTSPEKRRVGMVFQDFALFPHLTVHKNISFGLRRMSLREINICIDEMMELCDLKGTADSFPHELSGGQQQRIALARALATKPDLLLLDEPFSRLDATLHEKLSRQVRDILKARHQTTLMVTHNQNEAFLIADSGGVINEGSICQWDEMSSLYHRPRCTFVAQFVGEGVLIPGRMMEDGVVQGPLGNLTDGNPKSNVFIRVGEPVKVLLRPDNIVLDEKQGTSAVVERCAFRGATTLYFLRLESGELISSICPSHVFYSPGDKVLVNARMRHLILFPSLE